MIHIRQYNSSCRRNEQLKWFIFKNICIVGGITYTPNQPCWEREEGRGGGGGLHSEFARVFA